MGDAAEAAERRAEQEREEEGVEPATVPNSPPQPEGEKQEEPDYWIHDLTIYERVSEIVALLPAIGKTQENEQQHFMYRGHDDVMNALNPLLSRFGVFFTPEVIERIPAQRTTARGSIMYEVNLHVRYRFYGIRGDSFYASAWGEGTDSGDKSTNKAMTMALKNVLAQVFALSTAELSDADAGTPEETYGAGARPARREFDPAVDLLEGAIREKSGDKTIPQLLMDALGALDPTVDWPATITAAVSGCFGVGSRSEIPEPRVREFWTRLANAEAKARAGRTGDFPPPEEEILGAAFGWAFGIPKFEVVVVEAAVEAEPAADTPPEPGAEQSTQADEIGFPGPDA